jgi:hypothetical protein
MKYGFQGGIMLTHFFSYVHGNQFLLTSNQWGNIILKLFQLLLDNTFLN